MDTQNPPEISETTTSRAPGAFSDILSSERDRSGALLTIRAGAFGEDSQEWVKMLVRMYSQWGASHNYKVHTLEIDHSSKIEISGDWAYGSMRSEIGVHRLVRISPFDTEGRRLACFASVMVAPDIGEPDKGDDKAFEDYKKRTKWGSQTRSYVMHPYQQVSDLRTEYKTSDVAGVLDGNLDAFIEAYLRPQK